MPQPALASIAKREEIMYVYGQEHEPVVLDRRSPVLHLVQKIRDESHRFAVTYHRKRREMRDRDSELDDDSRGGPAHPAAAAGTLRQRARHRAGRHDALTAVVSAATAARIREHFDGEGEA